MQNFLKNEFTRWLFATLFVFCGFLVADFVLLFLVKDYAFATDATIIFLFVTAGVLAKVKSQIFVRATLAVFCVMQSFMLVHFLWYETPLNPVAIELALDEFGEVLESSTMAKASYWLAFFGVVGVYILLAVFLARFTLAKSPRVATFLLVAILLFTPYKALFKTKKINNFLPRTNRVTLVNAVNVFVGYAVFYSGSEKKQVAYAPYEVKFDKTLKTAKNVVLVVGESVSASHFSLFGYARKTDERLSALAKRDANFLAKRAFSSSVLTRISLPMFANVAYEPDNYTQIQSTKTHLTKLAKEAGFKVFYISNQSQNEADAFLPALFDYYFVSGFGESDLVLLEELKKAKSEFGEKNFVILHQRSPHSPYEKSYKEMKECEKFGGTSADDGGEAFDQKRIDTYDNAICFTDFVVSSVFEFFKDEEAVVYFVPDHAEAMGESASVGLNLTSDKNESVKREWGHAFLSPNVANVAFFASSYGFEMLGRAGLKAGVLTHYKIAQNVALNLGFRVKSPLEKEGEFYINGVSLLGDRGFLKGTVLEDGRVVFEEYGTDR